MSQAEHTMPAGEFDGTQDSGLRVEVEGRHSFRRQWERMGQKCKDPVLGAGSTALPGVAGNRTQLYRTEVLGLFRALA